MWKIYLIEILGNSVFLFVMIGFFLVVATVFYCIYSLNEETFSKKKAKRLIASIIICFTIASLMPSKKFMFVTLGVNETVEFLKNNEEAKKISSKTIKMINKTLDVYLGEDIVPEVE